MVGFDFAPIVFFNDEMNALEVDMDLIHDVKEQALGKGEIMYATECVSRWVLCAMTSQ